ncbi:MAG: phosphate ABC transporter permease subunit PstC [Gemmataceae bacterium]|nr:phosphate ABC transporter permease subunit PstC [Gemmataceae bacterium]
MAIASTPLPATRRTMHDMMKASRTAQKVREAVIEIVLLGCGLMSIVVTLAIALVLIVGTIEFFTLHNGQAMSFDAIWDRVAYFFVGTDWTAAFSDAVYGILPLLEGTVMVAVIAAFIALPIGLMTAIYLSEYAPPRVRSFAKPTLELLAGIPTVVYGFFAITVVTPLLVSVFGEGIGNPNNVLSGGIVVGIMIIPMVASLSEDSLRAVPRALRDGAIALGANKFETSVKVVLPAALSGVTASFLLAVSRAIGETMAVTLACGDAANWTWPPNPAQGAATMTSFIVRIAKGDVQHGSTDFNSLFAVACFLFFITLSMNILAQKVLRKYRQVYQ